MITKQNTGNSLNIFLFSPIMLVFDEVWPTNEMLDRGQPWGLLLGVLVAIPSGAGVALSVLGILYR